MCAVKTGFTNIYNRMTKNFHYANDPFNDRNTQSPGCPWQLKPIMTSRFWGEGGPGGNFHKIFYERLTCCLLFPLNPRDTTVGII